MARVCYVFWVKPPDQLSFPMATNTQASADNYPYRCTRVIRVEVPLNE